MTEQEARRKYAELVTLTIVVEYFDKVYSGPPIIIATGLDYAKEYARKREEIDGYIGSPVVDEAGNKTRVKEIFDAGWDNETGYKFKVLCESNQWANNINS